MLDPQPSAAEPDRTEPLNDDQNRLLSILLESDEPLDASLVARVHKAQVRGLRGYLLHRFAAWCVAGRQLDRHFVNLDLLIDHGPQHDGQRFELVRHASLPTLLAAEPDTRGWVLIGEPGSGKSTVLQHHELLMARAGLRGLAKAEPLPELCLWQRLADCPHDVADPAAWLAALREHFDDGVRRYFPGATEAYKESTLKVCAKWSAEQAEAKILASFAAQVCREPAFWQDNRFNLASQPVVGISLFEAQAYARWLAAQTGQPIRLPVEAEWEAAARGPLARRWPWEDGVNPGPWRINADPAHVRRTIPVGVLIEGDTPEGLSDMAGNVWDWTTSEYTTRLDETKLKAEVPDGMARRVLRGGSWDGNPEDCRASYRFRVAPDYRNLDLGLRVVLGPIQFPGP